MDTGSVSESKPIKLILRSILSPGDAMTLTAAIESLHLTYPNEYLTDVRTSTNEIWENNPFITPLRESDADVKNVEIKYPTVHCSKQTAVSFINGYLKDLERIIERPLRVVTNRPHLYLSDDEKKWINQIRQNFSSGRSIPFWVVNAGIKKDFTTKQWPIEFYQEVINSTLGVIQWVQVGSKEHDHPTLKNCIDCRGQTDHRQLMRMIYHCNGGLGPVTYLQHICAAFEKPYICLVGGRESPNWCGSYPKQMTLHTIGQLECCKDGGCWKSRVLPLGDSDEKDKSICNYPIFGLERPVSKCMAMIKPVEVVNVLQRYHNISL